jgi:uncharacterized protein YktB (UPF0637 family)
LHTSSSEPRHKDINDPIEPNIPAIGQRKFLVSLEKEKGNESVFEDVHQFAEKKHNPRIPKSPSIVIHEHSKRGLDEYEGFNVSLVESVVERPLEKKLKKKGKNINKLE